jgi:hypothetical protein
MKKIITESWGMIKTLFGLVFYILLDGVFSIIEKIDKTKEKLD